MKSLRKENLKERSRKRKLGKHARMVLEGVERIGWDYTSCLCFPGSAKAVIDRSIPNGHLWQVRFEHSFDPVDHKGSSRYQAGRLIFFAASQFLVAFSMS